MNNSVSRIVVIETRLNTDSDLVTYLKESVSIYSLIYRKIWYEMIKSDFSNKYNSLTEFKQHCRDIYDVCGRVINSIVNEISGKKQAYIELKKTELKAVEQKIKKLHYQIKKCIDYIENNKPTVTKNYATSHQLYLYRKSKRRLFKLQKKLNKCNFCKQNLKYIIDNQIYKICFGSKKQFNKQFHLELNHYNTHEKWYNDFVKHRDKNMYFLGAKNETKGNQLVQLTYNLDSDTFDLQLRKINKPFKGETNKYITYSGLTFNYRKSELIQLLTNQTLNVNTQPLTYRFIRRMNKWYLQVIFESRFEETEYVTSKFNGVIGLDYNDGFIQLSETDKSGNLIHLQKYNLKFHGCGNKAKTEVEQTLHTITKYAVKVGKDIVIEDLDFKKTKSKQFKAESEKGKDYNRMLHRFDYSRYKQKLKDITFNQKVFLALVSPKNTSKIGKQKYSNLRKLTVHQAASYVIARRYQGFTDNLKLA